MYHLNQDKFDFIVDEGEEGGGIRIILVVSEVLRKDDFSQLEAVADQGGVTIGGYYFKANGVMETASDFGDVPDKIYLIQVNSEGRELWFMSLPLIKD